MQHSKIELNSIDAFVFDFDGVLTNNLVYLSEDGKESVSCNRSDGLAFDVLRKLNKPAFILSTENNPVVTARAKKLRIPVLQGIGNKADALAELVKTQNFNLERILFVGNDLNDYYAMRSCGYSACPVDSHKRIKQLAMFTLDSRGGEGVVRELLEDMINLDFVEILYPKGEM